MSGVPRRRLGCAWLLFALLASPVSAQQTAPSATSTVRNTASASIPKQPSLDVLLERVTDLEKQQRWQQAADLYERVLRMQPNRTDLRQRWRLAEQRHSLTRRYHDSSFLGEMLVLPDDKALTLYQEVVRKIQAYYVETVDLQRLIRAGITSLTLALSEPVFVQSNIRAEYRADVDRLREALRQRTIGPIGDVAAAVEEVRAIQQVCQPYFIRPAAVPLEFVTAACECLDPYSAHLTPNRLRDLYAMIDGNFVGLGVEVRGEKDGLRIANVLPESPAEEGRLREGDLIVEVDKRSLAHLPAEEAANTLQGPAGSKVRLVLQGGNGSLRTVTLPRREVVVHSVGKPSWLTPERRFAYVRLSSFQKNTASELTDAVQKLGAADQIEGVVLDLRGNPGGLLDVAVQVANRFLPSGVVVRTRGRAWGQSWNHEAKQTKAWQFRLAVLVDGDSASASEILAGAIKDHHRGVVIGTRTYGKGSVQSIFPLQSVSTGLRLTTAKFYSPSDKAYEGVGVEPDVIVGRPLIGPLCEEAPVPRHPSPNDDPQLQTALRWLRDGSVEVASLPIDKPAASPNAESGLSRK